jgi:hypothetical protein
MICVIVLNPQCLLAQYIDAKQVHTMKVPDSSRNWCT